MTRFLDIDHLQAQIPTRLVAFPEFGCDIVTALKPVRAVLAAPATWGYRVAPSSAGRSDSRPAVDLRLPPASFDG